MLDLLALITNAHWRLRIERAVPPVMLKKVAEFLEAEMKGGKTVFPAQANWFRAINELPLDKVKVVIIGQDPYHGVNQAHGLSFSVNEPTPLPPSLKNIFKEQKQDVHIDNQTGDLSTWLEQGVLLLNTALTVEQGKAGSHSKCGWETITDAIIACVNEQRQHVVFLLWGAHAQKKNTLIDDQQHCILTAPHPSPLSAHRGWFGCRHFSKANDYLTHTKQTPIDWQIPNPTQTSLF